MIPTQEQIDKQTLVGTYLQQAAEALEAAQSLLDAKDDGDPVIHDAFFDGALTVWLTVSGSALEEALSAFATVMANGIAERAHAAANEAMEAGQAQVTAILSGRTFGVKPEPQSSEQREVCQDDCHCRKE